MPHVCDSMGHCYFMDDSLTKQIINWISHNHQYDDEILLADGFETAFVGLGQQFDRTCAVYDYDECIKALIEEQGMTASEAFEHFSVNVLGSYVGETTPIFLTKFEKQ